MAKKLVIALLILLCAAYTAAQGQTERSAPSLEDLQLQIQAMSDSLLQLRESEVQSEYGFKDTDRLADVAAKLKIANLPQWKTYLEIEPDNPALDKMSLRKLGISPYRALLAQQFSIHGFTELSTLGDLAHLKQLPVKKLRQFAGIAGSDKSRDGYSLQALGKTPAEFQAYLTAFGKTQMRFGLNITLVGVLIVFAALALVALIIGQLRHLNRPPKAKDRTLVVTTSGKVKQQPADLNADVIAAAITALHLYRQGIEERRRLLLTFRRARIDQWRDSALLNMPNRDILRKRS